MDDELGGLTVKNPKKEEKQDVKDGEVDDLKKRFDAL